MISKEYDSHRSNLLPLCLLLALAVGIIAFIFSNSLADISHSMHQSNRVLAFVTALLDPHHAIPQDVWSYAIRKTAHATEFAMLGGEVTVLAFFWARYRQSRLRFQLPAVLLLVLLVAVCDELIQSFNDRTSSVRDVLIDFGGGSAGVLLATLLITWAICLHRRRQNRRLAE